jgi:hypothetical protein
VTPVGRLPMSAEVYGEVEHISFFERRHYLPVEE